MLTKKEIENYSMIIILDSSWLMSDNDLEIPISDWSDFNKEISTRIDDDMYHEVAMARRKLGYLKKFEGRKLGKKIRLSKSDFIEYPSTYSPKEHGMIMFRIKGAQENFSIFNPDKIISSITTDLVPKWSKKYEKYEKFEVLGFDSDVDKQLIITAQEISRMGKCCYIATNDTGIQLEVESLRSMGMKIYTTMSGSDHIGVIKRQAKKSDIKTSLYLWLSASLITLFVFSKFINMVSRWFGG